MTAAPCRCGHGRFDHEHYRRGTDCSACWCPRFKRSWWKALVGR